MSLTIVSIHAFLVMYLHGVMSTLRESSFLIRLARGAFGALGAAGAAAALAGRPGLRPGAGIAHGKRHAGQQGHGAGVAACAVRVLRVGLSGVVGGLRRETSRADVHRRTGFVYARRACGRACPLQGQAEHQQQGKQAGTHRGRL